MADYDAIVSKIDNHLKTSGGQYYQDFYIGITNNIKRRLFNEHQVSEHGDWWAYIQADSVSVAREVERHYIELGMRGGTGGGSVDAIYVYCYKVTPYTKETNGGV